MEAGKGRGGGATPPDPAPTQDATPGEPARSGAGSATTDADAGKDPTTRVPDERAAEAAEATEAAQAAEAASGASPEPPRPSTAGVGVRPSMPRHRAAGGAGPATAASQALEADSASVAFPLHAAAYYGDLDALRRAIFEAKRADGDAEPREGESGDAGGGVDHSSSASHSRLTALDACGNTALHVCVLRRRFAAMDVLLDDDVGNFPLDARSACGWTALQEAVHLRDRRAVAKLMEKRDARLKRDASKELPRVLSTLEALPDFSMKIHWEFGSNVFGPIVRAYAPSDTYAVTKIGRDLRVDGELRGVEDERGEAGTASSSSSVLPKWRRGKFSVLFRGGEDAPIPGEDPIVPPTLFYVDREAKEAVDMDQAKADAEIAATPGYDPKREAQREVDEALLMGSTKSKYAAEDVRFVPVKSWLGGNRVEKVGEWRAEVWDASGKMSKRRVTRAGAFRTRGSFGEYLRSKAEGAADTVEARSVAVEDELEEAREEEESAAGASSRPRTSSGPSDDESASNDAEAGVPPSASPPANRSRASSSADAGEKEVAPLSSRERRSAAARGTPKEPKPRKVTARCWLAEGFPIRADDLASILDVASRANKHLKKVRRLVEYWRERKPSHFPVKVQVPIVLTVFAVARFRDFTLLSEDERSRVLSSRVEGESAADGFFDVPRDFARKSLVQAMKEAEEKERRLMAAEAKARREEAASKRAAADAKRAKTKAK